jgi:glycopeptide antibiotics resistance protein
MTQRQRFLAARAAYVAVVLLATLTDLHFSGDLHAAAHRLVRALEPSLGWHDAVDGLRNAALFAGLGAIWVVTSLGASTRAELRGAALVGFALSATVEGLQVFSPTRTASIVDLASNTAGALVGAAVIALTIDALRRSRGARSFLGIPGSAVAMAYGLAVLCEALTPLFRNELLPWMEGGPLASLRYALWASTQLSLGAIPLSDLLLYAPVGALAVLALSERGKPVGNRWPVIAAWLGVLAVAAEIAHGLIRLPIHWEAAATHVVALAAGAWAARRGIGPLSQALRGPVRARAALATYAALLVVWGWRPFVPGTSARALASQFDAIHLVPLLALASRVDVFSAVHVAQQFLLYAPLGALLAVWPLRSSGRWAHLWPALWLTLAIEAGHIVLADRFLDVTNALIGAAGLAVGWVVVRRAGFEPYGDALAEPGRAPRTSDWEQILRTSGSWAAPRTSGAGPAPSLSDPGAAPPSAGPGPAPRDAGSGPVPRPSGPGSGGP